MEWVLSQSVSCPNCGMVFTSNKKVDIPKSATIFDTRSMLASGNDEASLRLAGHLADHMKKRCRRVKNGS